MDTRPKNKKAFVPFALPFIGDEEIDEVSSTLRSGWITTGPKTREFEEAFATFVGCKHALAANSWTAAAHLAMEAAGIGREDIVLTPTWTFTATAEVARYLGADPVFVDVEKKTLNLDIEKLDAKCALLQKKFGERVKAIAPVHFAGLACQMQDILNIAEKYRLKIIEDAAHALPTNVESGCVQRREQTVRKIGSVGHATAFSFYATKTLATGEGGMLTTDDDDIAARARVMRLHGISRDVWNRYRSEKPSWYYEVIAPGFKYNLTDVASSLGIVQLRKAESFRERRQAIAEQYNKAFSPATALEVPSYDCPPEWHSWHLYVLRLNLKQLSIDRNTFIKEMAQRGVGCSVHFIPLHLQPYWRNKYNLHPSDFPVATSEFERVVSLPIYPSLTPDAIDHVISTVMSIVDEFRV